VLVWVDKIAADEDRSVFDTVLRDVATRGVWVSSHPDVIEEMGTKEVLYRIKHLGWGSDSTSTRRGRAGCAAVVPRVPVPA
jgi:hypothetical protein